MFPAPSLRNKEPTEEDRIKRLQKIKPEVIREALYNSLPKTWRDEFERRETIDVRELSEPVFMDIMLRIEEEDNAFRAKSPEEPKEAVTVTIMTATKRNDLTMSPRSTRQIKCAISAKKPAALVSLIPVIMMMNVGLRITLEIILERRIRPIVTFKSS